MKEMKFNPYGFIAPKTKQEYIALLDEAILMADDIAAQWDAIFNTAENSKKSAELGC